MTKEQMPAEDTLATMTSLKILAKFLVTRECNPGNPNTTFAKFLVTDSGDPTPPEDMRSIVNVDHSLADEVLCLPDSENPIIGWRLGDVAIKVSLVDGQPWFEKCLLYPPLDEEPSQPDQEYPAVTVSRQAHPDDLNKIHRSIY